ncbi:hypothetical protein [Curtobacterium sp. MCBD17_040]|uniref:hypothetical protein n=1 Tax=Curtobacterium sp. MCBD17_040 TaxID=2175674 RepID=UPI000DA91F18|nr:hypothetical protein [Curtobacterium sp. MCBD17_040]WIB65684.1 hypothetical protein DEI94_16315 [Curtobacterium sp. MCBD17_040]
MADIYRNKNAGIAENGGRFAQHTRAEYATQLGATQPAAAVPAVPQARIEYDRARSMRTTAGELDALAASKSDVVRLEVAQNPNASAKTLRHLAGSGDRLVRDVARWNPSYQAETLGERVSVALTRFRRGGQPSRLVAA